MKATVADLFDAYCRWVFGLSQSKERDILSRALKDCRHEVELSPEDYRLVEPLFSKTGER